MQLLFKGGNETVTFDLDRKKKEFYLTSAKTNRVKTLMEWKQLFDKDKEELQEKLTDKLNDSMFIKAIEINMAKVGYTLFYKKC